MPDYTKIFCDNINWIREQRGITRQELAALAGISNALMTDISRGTANPTLKIMETISEGLGIPLPMMFKNMDADEWKAVATMLAVRPAEPPRDIPHIPDGYELLEQVVLPHPKADVVKEWLAAPRRGRPRKTA